MANRVNEDERLARKWIEGQGFTDIRRPCEDPPDYVVNGCNAVEVRRLNSMNEIEGRVKGEESSRIPLYETVKNILKNIEPPGDEETWFIYVEYDFSFPLPKGRIVEKQTREALHSFIYPYEQGVVKNPGYSYRNKKHSAGPDSLSGFHRCLPCGICLDLGKGGSRSSKFELVEVSDDKGCIVLPELIKNINICVEEKSQKIEGCINYYDSWWLLLVDHMSKLPLSSILQDSELKNLRKAISSREPWSRIVIISPINPEWFYEL